MIQMSFNFYWYLSKKVFKISSYFISFYDLFYIHTSLFNIEWTKNYTIDVLQSCQIVVSKRLIEAENLVWHFFWRVSLRLVRLVHKGLSRSICLLWFWPPLSYILQNRGCQNYRNYINRDEPLWLVPYLFAENLVSVRFVGRGVSPNFSLSESRWD